MNRKNQYIVKKIVDGEVVEHSYHNGFDNALIQRDDILRKLKKVSAWIEYRGHIVEQDVKRGKKSGILRGEDI